MKQLEIPVYNFPRTEPSITDKRLYSDDWLEADCPNCGEALDLNYNTGPLLYVPEEYDHVGWNCDECETDGHILKLLEVFEGVAICEKHPEFKGLINHCTTIKKVVDYIDEE